jgi:uncharacterized RmlC-like cupin family protein
MVDALHRHARLRLDARGEYSASAKAGDFIRVPAFLPHMEINPSDSEPFHWVVVRSTSTPIVVNLPDDTWPARQSVDATPVKPRQ